MDISYNYVYSIDLKFPVYIPKVFLGEASSSDSHLGPSYHRVKKKKKKRVTFCHVFQNQFLHFIK